MPTYHAGFFWGGEPGYVSGVARALKKWSDQEVGVVIL